MNIQETNVQVLPLKYLHENKGQIDGVPANPRILKDDKYRSLLESLRKDDLTGVLPLKIYKHEGENVVLGGNMRLKALRELRGNDYAVSCVEIPEGTPVDVLRKIVVLDNSTFGEWDFDMLANEWDSDDLKAWSVDVPTFEEQDEEPTAQEDYFDEEKDKVETVCKEGDLWQLGDHRLLCGDSTKAEDVQRLMQGELADLWLTDPPYNCGYGVAENKVKQTKHKAIENDLMDSDQYYNFINEAFTAAASVLKSGAAYYIWYSDKEHSKYQTVLANLSMPYKAMLIWNKNALVLSFNDYKQKHEVCLYGWTQGAKHYFIDIRNEVSVIPDAEEINIDKMEKEEMRELLHKIYDSKIPTTIIDEKKPTNNESHPTMKPIRLFARLVRNSSRKGEIVLDTFGGSGTTIVACEQLGRKARMMELDPHYCDVIIARWEKLTGQTATKL